MVATVLLALAYVCDTNLTVTFVDVGQGDAIVLNLPDNSIGVIDGGPGAIDNVNDVYYARPLDLLQDIDTIDFIVLSHFHDDHYKGIIKILENKPVKQFFYAIDDDTIKQQEFMSKYIPSTTKIYAVTKGDTILKQNELNIAVLHPDKVRSNTNDCSIVLRIVYRNVSFLLTGDIEEPSLKALWKTIPKNNIRSDVLKVPHHGSERPSSFEFIWWVFPRYAVISVGNNGYGHPNIYTIGRLIGLGAKAYRTDTKGDIILTTDGHLIKTITTEKPDEKRLEAPTLH